MHVNRRTFISAVAGALLGLRNLLTPDSNIDLADVTWSPVMLGRDTKMYIVGLDMSELIDVTVLGDQFRVYSVGFSPKEHNHARSDIRHERDQETP